MNFSDRVEEIARDNRSGASEMLARAAEVFSLIDVTDCDLRQARRTIFEACARLIEAQPSMAPMMNLASEVARAVDLRVERHPVTARDLVPEAEKAARLFVEEAKIAVEKVSLLAADLIKEGSRILTHSRSSTVRAALICARRSKKSFRVTATESRPVFEGRTLASELAREGISVALITDAAAASVMDETDFVIVGADRLTPHVLVNKTGTRMIALAAKEKNIPVYALADRTKFTAVSLSAIDSHPAEEVWEDAPAGVEIINSYFEAVPLDLLTAVVTDDGSLTPDEASLKAAEATIHPALAALLDDRRGKVR